MLQVQDFLRGPQQKATFSFFNNLPHARNWANKHFDSGTRSRSGYSATSSFGGRGGSAFCTVTKTDALHKEKLAQHKARQKELHDFMQLVRAAPAAAAAVAAMQARKKSAAAPNTSAAAVPAHASAGTLPAARSVRSVQGASSAAGARGRKSAVEVVDLAGSISRVPQGSGAGSDAIVDLTSDD
jgi:hypothetical protein